MNLVKSPLFLIMFIIVIVSSCKQEDSNPVSENPNATVESEQQHVQSMLSDNIFTVMESVQANLVDGQTIAQLNQLLGNNNNQQQMAQVADDNEEFSEDDLANIVDLIFSNRVSSNGNEYMYSPDPQVCVRYLAKNNPQSCVASMEHITILLKLESKRKGHIAVFYDAHNPFILSYRPNGLDFIINLKDFENTLRGVNEIIAIHEPGEGMQNIPTLEGQILLSLTKENSVLTIALALLQDLVIHAQDPNGNIDIEIETSMNLASLIFNNEAKSITASVDILSVFANFPMKKFNNESMQDEFYPASVSFDGFNATVSLNELVKMITVSNVGIKGDHTFKLDVESERFAEVFLEETSLALVASENKPQLVTLSDVNASISVLAHPRNSDGAGSMSIQIAPNTYVEVNHQNEGDILKILSGSVHLVGSGDIQGEFSGVAGDCLSGIDGDGPHFPFAAVVCPL